MRISITTTLGRATKGTPEPLKAVSHVLSPSCGRKGLQKLGAIDPPEAVDVDDGECRVITPLRLARGDAALTEVVHAIFQTSMLTHPPYVEAVRSCDMTTPEPDTR